MRLLPVPLHPDQQKELLKIARQAVENYVRGGKTPEFQVSDPALCKKGAAFVTLRKKGALRGCVGHLFPVTALHASVRGNAIAAASRDSRFEPVTREELKDLKIEISVLSVPQRAAGADEIVMREHGVIVKKRIPITRLPPAGGGRNRMEQRGIFKRALRSKSGSSPRLVEGSRDRAFDFHGPGIRRTPVIY